MYIYTHIVPFIQCIYIPAMYKHAVYDDQKSYLLASRPYSALESLSKQTII